MTMKTWQPKTYKFSSVTQLCLTLCNPMDCSPPGSSVHGIFQARIVEWVAISHSRASSWPRVKPMSLAFPAPAGGFFTSWATYEIRYQIQGEKGIRNRNTWKLNYRLLNNSKSLKGSKKIHRNKWQWKCDNSKPMRCSKSSSKREVYSNTILPQETRKNIKLTT